jgi:hypothetical protein
MYELNTVNVQKSFCSLTVCFNDFAEFFVIILTIPSPVINEFFGLFYEFSGRQR